jgi:hypothetical protein
MEFFFYKLSCNFKVNAKLQWFQYYIYKLRFYFKKGSKRGSHSEILPTCNWKVHQYIFYPKLIRILIGIITSRHSYDTWQGNNI